MKRIVIFVLYDTSSVVHDYVQFFLSDIKLNVEKLIIVSNCHLDSCERMKLLKYSDDLIIRSNAGYDFGAWKEIITCYLTQTQMKDYDEIVLVNDSCFGPLYSFKLLFEKMGKVRCDFWGITSHEATPTTAFGFSNWYGFCPKHIQSYFIAIRKRMFSSCDFEEFWNNMPIAESIGECVDRNETVFTKYFEDRGYHWTTYIDMLEADRIENSGDNKILNYTMFAPDSLLKLGTLLIKKKVFLDDYDSNTIESNKRMYGALEYILKNTKYDINLIKNYLQNSGIKSSKKEQCLKYINEIVR